ncbi:CopY/TcrY family copper transport repressor, partial [Limosilactobacillus fermentum]
KIKTAPDAVPCDCVPGMIDAECCTVQENGRA